MIICEDNENVISLKLTLSKMFQKATTYAFNAEITFNLLLILFLLFTQKPTGTAFLRKQTNRGEWCPSNSG